MWWNDKQLNQPQKAKDGSLWHFRVWHDHISGTYTQRIFFWDDECQSTGLIEFSDDQTIPKSKLRQRINKIMRNSEYRQKFLQELKFPVERNY